MECRPMEIRLLSASGIQNVNRFTKMDVFALVLVAGDPRSRQRCPTKRRCGTCPNWNYSLRFTLDESALVEGRLTLIFQLRSERLLGDKDIGHLHIPLIQLFSPEDIFKEHRLVHFNLTTNNGKQKGTINFSYSFGTKFKMSIKLPPQMPPPLPLGTGSSAERLPREKNAKGNVEMGLGVGMLGMGGVLIATDLANEQGFDGGFDHGVDSMGTDMGMDF